jgi:hypothetical protein
MNKYTDGDARRHIHAEACGIRSCGMSCRCWCHGITHYTNGDIREDAKATELYNTVQWKRIEEAA